MKPTVPRYRPRGVGHDAAADATSAGACPLGGDRGVEPGASRYRASCRARGGDRARAPFGGIGGRAGGLFDAPRRSPAARVCAAAESVAAARAPDSGARFRGMEGSFSAIFPTGSAGLTPPFHGIGVLGSCCWPCALADARLTCPSRQRGAGIGHAQSKVLERRRAFAIADGNTDSEFFRPRETGM
jgi:hypothetical protein